MSQALTITSDPHRSGGYVLHAEAVLAAPLDEVFAFFSKAENLEQLTPPWLEFRLLTPPPIEMRVGATIDYRIKLKVVPMNWRSEITVWEPGVRFVDEQRRGPYKYWEHEHRFEGASDGTRMVDHVHYGVPGGALVHKMMVRPDLERIFRYRQKAQGELFGER